ncbi:hypothetical protein [Halobaculum lipolyticum]|uniref:DUF8060 domain-containing protein n=1 Tax=Halobaculum lipolyticum TaxID=3032001 RepID=A0ABD5WGJ2_9EURY|nr:hypothetical protein [Halobaculum sp. DT31]
MSEEHATAPGPDEVSTTTDDDSRDLARYVNYVALAALVVLALVAGVQFYTAVSRTIGRWVADDYRSIVYAAFNLAVLLIAAAGISWQVRRLTE